jgi:hypothetical protein
MTYKDPQKQKDARRRYYLRNKYNIIDPLSFPPLQILETINE